MEPGYATEIEWLRARLKEEMDRNIKLSVGLTDLQIKHSHTFHQLERLWHISKEVEDKLRCKCMGFGQCLPCRLTLALDAVDSNGFMSNEDLL